MNYIDLFSGIGGFALGAYWAGMKFENHYFSEVDPYCVELYQKRFPDAIPLGDITKYEEWDIADGEYIITGGFPCQDISYAGKGAGIEGERSGLWKQYAGVIRKVRPMYAIVENVSALLARGIDVVLGDLAKVGYDAEWQDIRASDVGAPHRRERIWIVAYPECDGRESRRAEREGQQGRSASIGTGSHVADTETPVRWWADGAPYTGWWNPQTGRCDVPRHWPEYWAVEPDVGRLAHGVPRRVDRLRGLGNAVVPQIAEYLFRLIDRRE